MISEPIDENLKLYAGALSCIWYDGSVRIEAMSIRAYSPAHAVDIGVAFFCNKYPNCSNHICVVDEIKAEYIPPALRTALV